MPQSQPQSSVQRALPRPVRVFTPGVVVLLVLLVAGFALQSVAPGLAANWFALRPQGVLHGRLWQLATYSLVNDVSGLLFGALALLLIGSAIEREWRARSFLGLWLVAGIGAGVVWTVVGLLAGKDLIGSGCASCIYGLLASFGLVFRRKRHVVLAGTMEAQHMAMLFIGAALLMGLLTAPITCLWATGAGVAYLYIKLLWRVKAGGGGSGTTSASRFSVEID